MAIDFDTSIEDDYDTRCPVCRQPIDYCFGHGEIATETLGFKPNDYGFVCPEFDNDGSCIHSDHMMKAGM